MQDKRARRPASTMDPERHSAQIFKRSHTVRLNRAWNGNGSPTSPLRLPTTRLIGCLSPSHSSVTTFLARNSGLFTFHSYLDDLRSISRASFLAPWLKASYRATALEMCHTETKKMPRKWGTKSLLCLLSSLMPLLMLFPNWLASPYCRRHSPCPTLFLE